MKWYKIGLMMLVGWYLTSDTMVMHFILLVFLHEKSREAAAESLLVQHQTFCSHFCKENNLWGCSRQHYPIPPTLTSSSWKGKVSAVNMMKPIPSFFLGHSINTSQKFPTVLAPISSSPQHFRSWVSGVKQLSWVP